MQSLDTPSIIVDQAVMERNIVNMGKYALEHGVNLRPHIKTHKIPYIAKLQLAAGAMGITVAKVSEAEVMAQHGIDDIFIAYPIVTRLKADKVCKLAKAGKRMIVGVDSAAGAQVLSAAAQELGIVLEVRLEIDTGFQRTGILFEEAMGLAKEISGMKHLKLQGIYTFRGFSMNGKPTTDLERAGLDEGSLMVGLANELRSHGMDIVDVSAGSTPSGAHVAKVKGVTEIRPGTYVFNDRMQVKLGVCSWEDCAASVRVGVVSRPAPDRMIIDGGSKTFATDVLPGISPLDLVGYGHFIEAPHAVLERLSEEHGMVRIDPSDTFRVGDIVHVVPNHICPTINLHNRIWLQDGDRLESLEVAARGMVY